MKSSSPKAFKSNVKAEMKAGKPQKQALAIAYSAKRKNMAKGGSVDSPEGMCPDCTAAQACMKHGGPDEVTRDLPEYSSGGVVDNIGVSGQGSKEASHMPSSDTFEKRLAKLQSDFEASKNKDLPGLEREAHFAEGGAVNAMRPLQQDPENDNLEMDEQIPQSKRGPAEDVDEQLQSEQEYSDGELDLPKVSESLSLAAEIMKDRKRRNYAKGGSVSSMSLQTDGDEDAMEIGSLKGSIDKSDMSDLSNNSDELDNEPGSGREETRGMNISVPHVMSDDEHEESNSTDDSRDSNDDSLIGEILKDRKKRRRE